MGFRGELVYFLNPFTVKAMASGVANLKRFNKKN